jgi:hypothetical protein
VHKSLPSLGFVFIHRFKVNSNRSTQNDIKLVSFLVDFEHILSLTHALVVHILTAFASHFVKVDATERATKKLKILSLPFYLFYYLFWALSWRYLQQSHKSIKLSSFFLKILKIINWNCIYKSLSPIEKHISINSIFLHHNLAQPSDTTLFPFSFSFFINLLNKFSISISFSQLIR